jgi:hypothetical protein
MLIPVAVAAILLFLNVADTPVELTAVAADTLKPSITDPAPAVAILSAVPEGLLMIDSETRDAEPATP